MLSAKPHRRRHRRRLRHRPRHRAGYAPEGAQVVVLDINGEAAAKTAAEISAAGGKAASYVLDVTRRDDCIAIAKKVEDGSGRASRSS